MVKVVCGVSARRSISTYPSAKARSRITESHEVSRQLEIRDGEKNDDDLVTAILRAIDSAESCRSGTTVKLLKMALLNEGVRLAANLPQENAASTTAKACRGPPESRGANGNRL